MLFESKLKRKQWINWVVLFIPDFIICAIIAWLLSGGIIGAILGFIALEIALTILTWIRALFLFAFNTYTFKDYAASLFLEDLTNNKFPEPNNYEVSISEYLNRVALGDDMPDAKFIAAYYIGYLECFRVTNQTLAYITMCTAFEDAITKYKNTIKTEQ